MSIIRSDNPPHARNICTGKKTVEWTKSPLPPGRMFCYETITGGGRGMVIGEAEVVSAVRIEPTERIKDAMIVAGCVNREFLRRYAGGKALYANFLVNPVLYDKPIPLSEFIYPSEGCCNEGKCRGCKWLDLGDEWAGLEDDCLADFDTDCFSPVRRPPQSWMYAERI